MKRGVRAFLPLRRQAERSILERENGRIFLQHLPIAGRALIHLL
jgi:hypothetical protein